MEHGTNPLRPVRQPCLKTAQSSRTVQPQIFECKCFLNRSHQELLVPEPFTMTVGHMGTEISCEKHDWRATLSASFEVAITETRRLVGASSSSSCCFTHNSYEIVSHWRSSSRRRDSVEGTRIRTHVLTSASQV